MYRLALLSSLIAQLAAVPCPPPSLSESSLALWSENVATFSDGSPRGYGLVVGWQAGRAWIAVPAHVAFGVDRVRKTLPATLQIRLAGDVNPRNLCPSNGELVNPRPPKFGVDLTFVCVIWDARPYFWTGLAAASTRVNDPAALIPTSTQLRGLVTRAPSPEGTNADDFVEAAMAGEPSLSGAPVGSPRGVVGLYLGIGANEARARARVLPIWQIRRQA